MARLGRPTKLMELEKRLERAGDTDLARAARGLLLGIMVGEISGPGTRDKLKAAVELLDREEGKPAQTVTVKGELRRPGEVLIGSATAADGEADRAVPLPAGFTQ